MQTNISQQFIDTPEGREANMILRSCVHCGFCTATCPTYQLLGDELDGPRGRIYLIKQMLEGNQATSRTQTHLDRCLTCRACETTCPSGVRYGRLLDIGREIIDKQVVRKPIFRFKRHMLRTLLPYSQRMAMLLNFAAMIKPLLPAHLKKKLPPRVKPLKPLSTSSYSATRRMLVLEGCVQSVATPQTNLAARSLLSKLRITLITAPEAGCCGAVSHHLSASAEGLRFMRTNIDAWWPYIEEGIEAIVLTASGCGVMVKEYASITRS